MADAYGQALLICDAVATDPNGKVTLYGLFDQIRASSFPTVHPLFAIYWRSVVPGPGRVTITILRPDGSTLDEPEPIEVSKEGSHSIQGTYTFGGFEFSSEGAYTVVLKYNGQELLRNTLRVSKRAES